MYIERDIEKKFLDWKVRSSCALEVEGSKQVGKTTTIKKFAKENFNNVIYINLDEISGEHFLESMDYCSKSYPANEFYLKLIETFVDRENLSFSNDEDTVIVIDEIQKNKKVYELIRPLNRYLNCRLIVTRSYLRETKQFFQPAGDTEKVTMYPINFLEFINLFGKRDFLENQNLLAWDSSMDDWFKSAYLNYTVLGGYPEVVIAAVQNDFNEGAVSPVKLKIIRLISDELKSQFDTIEGKEVKRCISWLLEYGVLDFCDVHDFAAKQSSTGPRVYFRDIGILNDVLNNFNFPPKGRFDFVAENFVFKTLNENFNYISQFGVYNKELNFLFSRNGISYGIVVNHDKNPGKTATRLLEGGKINKLIYFTDDTTGTVNKVITLPIWAAAVCKYDFMIEKEKNYFL